MSTSIQSVSENGAAHEERHLHAVSDGFERFQLKRAWTAAELMAAQFPEPKWAVPGIFAEGVSLLCGPPKVGKSWMSLGLGLTVASGGKAFGSIEVQGGPVLYLALEDHERRLQNRMGKLLDGRPAPENLLLVTSCPPMNQGGEEAITDWCQRNPDARMVVIDVLAKIRGAAMPGVSAYDADYASVAPLMRIAQRHNIAVVVIHHVRKQGSDDFLAEVSGTNGLAGAADATLVLKRARGQADGILHVTGRDVGETEHALSFNPENGAWSILEGPVTDHAQPSTRAAILRYLRTHPGSGPRAIAAGAGLGEPNVKATCRRMLADGQLISDGTARYSLPHKQESLL